MKLLSTYQADVMLEAIQYKLELFKALLKNKSHIEECDLIIKRIQERRDTIEDAAIGDLDELLNIKRLK